MKYVSLFVWSLFPRQPIDETNHTEKRGSKDINKYCSLKRYSLTLQFTLQFRVELKNANLKAHISSVPFDSCVILDEIEFPVFFRYVIDRRSWIRSRFRVAFEKHAYLTREDPRNIHNTVWRQKRLCDWHGKVRCEETL